MSDTYWEYILEGEESDGKFSNRDGACASADAHWADSIHAQNDNLRNGEKWEDTAVLLQYRGDEVVHKEDYEVEYEYYHGDLAEHGLLGSEIL